MDIHSRQILNLIARDIHQKNRSIADPDEQPQTPQRRIWAWQLRRRRANTQFRRRVSETRPTFQRGKQNA